MLVGPDTVQRGNAHEQRTQAAPSIFDEFLDHAGDATHSSLSA